MVVSGFDWDPANREKCEKHGLTAALIEEVFRGEVAVYPDPAHSASETRFIAIGTTGKGRHVFAAFTMRRKRGQMLIRPISARYMHAKEIRHYEEAAKAKRR